MNDCGDVVHRGGQNGGTGGFTMLSPKDIWYCGKIKGECMCGRCDGQCGPTNGCPCASCSRILVQEGKILHQSRSAPKLNDCGDLVHKGGQNGGTGGFTGLSPKQIWYCGKIKGECACGSCDGQCGPTNGCPCTSCARILVQEGKIRAQARRMNDCGDIVHRGGQNGGTGGFTGLSPKQIWYCGKIKGECACGSCDRQCGPTNGCPCTSCARILVQEGNILAQARRMNDCGDIVHRGGQNGGTGGFTMLSPKDIWYCGKIKGECMCGRCDGQCGPTNGCPCASCARLLGLNVVATTRPSDNTTVTRSNDNVRVTRPNDNTTATRPNDNVRVTGPSHNTVTTRPIENIPQVNRTREPAKVAAANTERVQGSTAPAKSGDKSTPRPTKTSLLNDNILDGFRCPITMEIMEDPVSAMDGHTYERCAIEAWLLKSDKSPKTNATLPSKQLVPNYVLRSMIAQWKETIGVHE